MGIAANQARLMTLTARQNDLEYKAQQISAIKMRISQTTSSLATQYADALNNYSKLNSAQQIGSQYSNDRFKVNNIDGSYERVSEDYVAKSGETVCTGEYLLNTVSAALHVGTVQSASGYLTVEQGKYNAETERLSSVEKIYDMELTQVNTEHQAIKTEYDAIKSLVKDNTEKSFNVFG